MHATFLNTVTTRKSDLQIRGFPVALRERLRRRARGKGLSMSQYVISILEDDLARPTVPSGWPKWESFRPSISVASPELSSFAKPAKSWVSKTDRPRRVDRGRELGGL